MALNTNRAYICPLYTDTANAAPNPAELDPCEIFINRSDKTLGFKAADGTIAYLIAKPGTTEDDLVHKAGNETITGQKTFTQVILGTAQYAQYHDLAERYLADQSYLPGTLIQFGGEQEITAARFKANGIISTAPGFGLNNVMKEGLFVALSGRVPVRVIGPVKKFDKIVANPNTPGVGIVNNLALGDAVIGRALEKKDSEGEGLVECVTRFTLA